MATSHGHRGFHALLESLESRRLLAAIFNGTDTDGDAYTVKLTGPGDLAVTTTGGGTLGSIANLVYSGTTLDSVLSISVRKAGGGDGVLILEDGGGTSPLKTFSAPSVDLVDTSNLAFGVLRKFVLRDARDDANISIGGSASDQVEITVRGLGVGLGDSGIQSTSRVKSFKAKEVDSGFTFEAGVDSFVATSVVRIFLSVEPGVPVGAGLSVGSMTLGGDATINIIVDGDIGTIKAGSFSADCTSDVDGRIGALTSTVGGIQGAWDARTFGAIRSKTSLTGVFRTRDVTLAGNSIDSFRAAQVVNAEIGLLPGQATAGLIGLIDVGSWSGGQISAGGIGVLKAKADFSPAVDLAPGAALAVSIGSATIGGRLNGTWNIPSAVNSLKAKVLGTSLVQPMVISHDGDLPSKLAKIAITGAEESFALIDARGIGDISSSGPLTLTSTITGTLAPNLALKSLTVKNRVTATVNCEQAGIGLIKAGEITVSAFRTLFISDVQVTGGSGTSGSINDCLLRAVGAGPEGFGVSRVRVLNAANDMRLRSFGPVGSVDVGTLGEGAVIFSGLLGGNGLPATLDPGSVNAAGRIDTVLVRKAFSAAVGGESFSNAAIVAPTIGNVTINGRIDTDNSGSPFGIGLRALTGKIKLKNTLGQSLEANVSGTPPVNLSVFPSSQDFVVRLYV